MTRKEDDNTAILINNPIITTSKHIPKKLMSGGSLCALNKSVPLMELSISDALLGGKIVKSSVKLADKFSPRTNPQFPPFQSAMTSAPFFAFFSICAYATQMPRSKRREN